MTDNKAFKCAVRARAERDGVPYAEARTRILAERAQTSPTTARPASRPGTTELVRLLQADQAAAGIEVTQERPARWSPSRSGSSTVT